MFLFLYLTIVIIYFVLLLLVTFGPNGRHRMSIDAVVSALNNDFQIGLHIMLPVACVFVTTILTRQADFAPMNWWIAVGICIARIAFIFIASRWRQVRLVPLFLLAAVGVTLSYYAVGAVLSDMSALSQPSPTVAVMILWLATILIISHYVRNLPFSSLDDEYAYNTSVRSLYTTYRRRFKAVVTPYFLRNRVAYRLLFAIMIAEDINRPGIVRFVERILFRFTNISTTGIMQMSADTYLSNRKSVTMAQELIQGSYKRHKKITEEYSLVRSVAEDYNGGVYPDLVVDIYFVLKEVDLKTQ